MIVSILFSLFLLSEREMIQRFPLDDVVILEHETNITLLPDNISLIRERMMTMPLTLEGREDYSDVRIPYHAPLQELTIHRCVATTEGGLKIDAEPHAFNPVTPDGYAMAPDFLGFREMVISPPGVAEGSILELEYTVRDSGAPYPWWEAEFLIGQPHPVISRSIRIQNRSGSDLQWRTFFLPPTGVSRQDSTGLSWSFRDIPAYPTYGISEEFQREIPKLQLSTCPSWESLSAWGFEILGIDRLPQEAVDSLGTMLVDAVTRPDTVQAVIRAADYFIRDIPAPARRFWTCRPPTRILHTGYAEPWERSAFIIALAGAVGVEAFPYLIGSPLMVEALPLLSHFREAQILIPGERPFWVNRHGVALWPTPGGSCTVFPLVPWNGVPVLEPGPGPATGTLLIRIRGVSEDSVSVRGEVYLSAVLVPNETYLNGVTDWMKSRLGTLMKQLEDVDIRTVEASSTGMRYIFEVGFRLNERLELHANILQLFGDAWLPPRSMPHLSPSRVSIHIPEEIDLGIELRVLPHDSWELFVVEQSEEIPGGKTKFDYAVSQSSDELSIRLHFGLLGGWLDVLEQMELRRLLARADQLGHRTVLIEE